MKPTLTFLNFPPQLPAGKLPRVCLVGVAHGSTYQSKDSGGYETAADRIRASSLDDANLIDNWDFDLEGPLFNGVDLSCIDIGSIPTTIRDNEGNRRRIESETREILASSAVPILIGGDCSITSPFLAAYQNDGPIWVLQIDAHIDWRDEVEGERYGYSSSMRRASEMSHISGLVQVGIRSVGSATVEDVAGARQYGSRFVTARQIHSEGIEAAIRHIPKGARVVITLDCDSLDPSIMPGVAARTPGGLTYTQVIDLMTDISRHAKIAGFNLTEYFPPNDIDGMSALLASRIVVNAIGLIVRQ